jgi:uncharacterized protein (TIGR03066 family)
MKRMMFGLLVCFTVALAGCSSSSTSGGSGNPSGGGGGDKLVGKWEMTKDIPELKMNIQMNLEFTSDNKFTMAMAMGGKEAQSQQGSYKHDGDKVTMTIKKGGKDDDAVMLIKKLTDTELVLVDQKESAKKGEEMAFTRKK